MHRWAHRAALDGLVASDKSVYATAPIVQRETVASKIRA